MSDADDTITAQAENKLQDNAPNKTGDIIAAIRRIMEAEDALLSDDPDAKLVSLEAQKRIYAALDRLTGGSTEAPTVLEALVLEQLQPLLGDWLDAHLPTLVERLVREEIRALLARIEKPDAAPQPNSAET
jgi:cell pole-organizing protein PopZ